MTSIRFTANYQVFGPTQGGVKGEVDTLVASSQKVSVSAIKSVVNGGSEVDPKEKFEGYVLTDEDAVDFFQDEQLPKLDLSKEKAVVQAEADKLLQQKFNLKSPVGKKAFAKAVGLYSHMLAFTGGNVTEKYLTQ